MKIISEKNFLSEYTHTYYIYIYIYICMQDNAHMHVKR